MPATVATSLRLNRSDAIVITVTGGLVRETCKAQERDGHIRTVDGADVATPVITSAPTVNALRRALIRIRLASAAQC